MPKSLSAKPFLKWAGGKTRLVPMLSELLPDAIGTYYEPFIGGGALFFHLAQQTRYKQAVVNDFNPEIVNCYLVVRDAVEALIEELGALEVSREAFYELRALDPPTLPVVRRAARTIYLNKTGFNGLYRLNKAGGFNVPWGDYKTPRILDKGNLRACSALLASVTVLEGDFVDAVQSACPGDAVYFDPPYVPLTATSNFKSYTKEGFTLSDQQRVATCFRQLSDRGAVALASNADMPVIHDIYDGFYKHVVRMRRNINSKGGSRGPVNELVITNRPDSRGF